MKLEKFPVDLIAIFVWIGFIGAISFMEAWLKFRAEQVTLPIGLSIGRLIFSALNKVEWTLALITFLYLVIIKTNLTFSQLIFFIIPIVILLIQTFLLLPLLNERVEIILHNLNPMPSYIHFYYLALEVIKVICLFIFGVLIFKLHTELSS